MDVNSFQADTLFFDFRITLSSQKQPELQASWHLLFILPAVFW